MTVKLYYYDRTNEKEVSSSTGCDLLINGVSSIGETTQTGDLLVFTHNSTFPGSGGYYFGGWSYSTNGGTSFISVDDSSVSFDASSSGLNYLEVRCLLLANTYTITYNFNNPDGLAAATQSVTYGKENVKLLYQPPYDGYVFLGWLIESELYAAESIYTPTSNNVIANAQWLSVSDESVYPAETISYQDEDEEGEAIDLTECLALLLAATKLKELDDTEDSVFFGWLINGTAHKKGSTYKAETGGVKRAATAIWQKRTITVTFDTKGGLPCPQPVSGEIGSTFTMPSAPYKDGSTFVSWYYNGGYWQAGTVGVPLNRAGTASATYSTIKNVQVTFDSNRGSEIPEAQRYRNVVVGQPYGDIFPDDPTLTNCKFLGWFTSPSTGSGYEVLSTTVVCTPKNHNLYARWSNEKALFNPYGGKIDGKTSEVLIPQIVGDLIDMPDTLTQPDDGRYPASAVLAQTFGGWYTSAATGGTEITSGHIVKKNEDLHLYARWAQCVYLDKNAKDAVCSVEYQLYFPDTKYNNLPSEDSEPSITRPFYTFLGWFTDPTKGHQVTSAMDVSIQTDRVLYAHWATVIQEVTFDGNNGTPSEAKRLYARPGYYTLWDVTATRENFDFIGWYDGTSSSSSEVTDDDEVTDEGQRTLYAHYVSKQTVMFFSYGGTFADGTTYCKRYYTRGETYGSFPSCTKQGRSLLGYFTSTSGGTQLRETDIVPAEGSTITVYAHWQEIEQCEITIDANGGTCSVSAMTKYKDEPMGGMPDATREDYSFDGYTTSSGTKVDSSTVVTGDMTITAQWSKKILLYYAQSPL